MIRPDPREAELEPALLFLRALWELNHALEKRSLSMRRVLGVTAQQRLLIRFLGRFPGITASQLARLLHLDRGTISATLNRLVGRGLVARTAHPTDRRVALLALTAKGRALDRPEPWSVEASVERLLRSTSSAHTGAARDVVKRLAEDLTRGGPRPRTPRSRRRTTG